MFPWVYEHILTVILISPLVGVLFLFVTPRKYEDASSEIALSSSCLTLFLSLVMLGLFKGEERFLFSESYSWMPWLNASYSVAVDGLSATLVVVVALLTLFIIMVNWKGVRNFQKEAFASILLFEIGLIGLLLSVDILLMYLFMEVSVVFLGMIILFLKAKQNDFLTKYLGFMSISSLLLFTVVIFFMLAAGSFNLQVVEGVTLSRDTGSWILGLLIIASSVRMGLFPFHGWLSGLDNKSIGPILIPVGLLFIASGYLLYRFLPPLAMVANVINASLTWIVVSSIIITALISTVQKNFGSLILYVLRVHFGFIMLGILSLNPQGIAGSGMEMIGAAASLSALSGLFVLLKRNKINLMEDDLKGVFAGSPILGVSFLIILFSLAGLPGLAHFPGLFMVWMGLFKGSWILTLVSLLGVVIITVPLVRFVGLALYRGEQADSGFKRLTSTQLLMISIFVVIILGIGIFPDIFMKNIKQSTEAAWKVFSHQI